MCLCFYVFYKHSRRYHGVPIFNFGHVFFLLRTLINKFENLPKLIVKTYYTGINANVFFISEKLAFQAKVSKGIWNVKGNFFEVVLNNFVVNLKLIIVECQFGTWPREVAIHRCYVE